LCLKIQNLQVITKPQLVKVGALGIKKEGENFDTPSSFFLNFYRNGGLPITYHHKSLIINNSIS
ncbi:hypothetical protein, partial [Parabacteroides merdae]|uniref:hypothetical protein n=1 Tax=Parabacteroides merdae TaxID=46503 RepID=UPI0023309B1F